MKTRRTWRTRDRRTETRSTTPDVLAAAAGLLRGRAGWAVASVLVVLLGLLAARLVSGALDDDGGTPPDTRARAYEDRDACLLTDERGIVSGGPAAPLWEGMQRASADGRVRVTYVPVMGERTVANARPFLNGLVQRDCEIVVASGPAQVTAATEAAAKNGGVRFVVVGEGSASGEVPENVTRIAAGEKAGGEVEAAVARLARED
ncbi:MULTISPECIES: BMP family ABC transporter substrate-binding protein [unclassified Streptomyces]|uniref:BMP family ABC transporter substrate-binding protein n=1 Tax=unclassified Streptomyces TaxID=2593676 RepID=UPI001F1051D0|nr:MULTISPECIES: BMP family ABC transporter substrate-binding protein [unclassified Streptomyces]